MNPQPEEEFVVVPVLADFKSNRHIGELRIAKSALPKTPEFLFSIGFKADGLPRGITPTTPCKAPYELVAIAIESDQAYARYLEQIGILIESDSEGDAE